MNSENSSFYFISFFQIVIPAIVSVLTVAITFWFSTKLEETKRHRKVDEDNYLKFHVPLIKHLSSFNPKYRSFFDVIVVARMNNLSEDLILQHFLNNIQYAPKETVGLVSKYFQVCGDLSYYDANSEFYKSPVLEKNMIEASNLYDQILLKTLQESSRLSKKLGYPDISQQILKSFLVEVNAVEANQRYLSAQERKSRK